MSIEELQSNSGSVTLQLLCEVIDQAFDQAYRSSEDYNQKGE